MTIEQFAKLFTNLNKSKIIAHLYTCKCEHLEVSTLCSIVDLEQSNMSKHLSSLRQAGVVEVEQDHKRRFYKLSEWFTKEWSELLELMIMKYDLKEYICKHY